MNDLDKLAAEAPSGAAILRECRSIARTLLSKNIAYGDSALNPVRVFSQASAKEQILVRLDDKLSRLQRGQAAGEDVTLDLIGYLVLLRVVEGVRHVVGNRCEGCEHSARDGFPCPYHTAPCPECGGSGEPCATCDRDGYVMREVEP